MSSFGGNARTAFLGGLSNYLTLAPISPYPPLSTPVPLSAPHTSRLPSAGDARSSQCGSDLDAAVADSTPPPPPLSLLSIKMGPSADQAASLARDLWGGAHGPVQQQQHMQLRAPPALRSDAFLTPTYLEEEEKEKEKEATQCLPPLTHPPPLRKPSRLGISRSGERLLACLMA